MGIGGVGMAGLALLLKACGREVSGCDLKATPRTDWLVRNGLPVSVGHSVSHLAEADELIVTPAVPADAPEYAAACARQAAEPGFRVRFRGEVLAELANGCETIAVCGSHGKTTTSTWIARLLLALGEDIAWCIGGETGDFPVAGVPSSGPLGADTPLVVEADESDGTLALYRAKTLVVNRCDYDHADHFRTADDYRACYDVARRQAVQVIESEDLGPLDGPAELVSLLASLPAHNRKNARAAIEVACRRGHSLVAIAQALPAIVAALPDRRFQPVWKDASGIPVVVSDYAHHPTEIRCALDMARRLAKGRVRVLFQPHRYSRTKALLADFATAFDAADEVVLCPTYAAFERPVEGGDVADLYAACRAAGRPRFYLARSCDEAWEHARNVRADGDVTVLLGAGDIIALVPCVQRDLAQGLAADRPRRRIWIGQGSNTWKSDLCLDEEYVRTSGPAGRPGAALGIPWMAGIPGTVGGWVKMNAGAFGHSISEVVDSVKVDGKWLSASDCGFAYRHSDIKGEIQDVRFKPEAHVGVSDPAAAAEFLAKRRKFPPHTWGSFFKNPPGDFAGRLLEAVGAKGMRVGGAFVWAEHANVIVAPPDAATPSDVLALAQILQRRVQMRLGVTLEPEVRGVTRC